MGQAPSGQGGGPPPERDPEKEKAERERRKKSYAARPPLHTGRRRRRNRGTGTSGKLPKVYPTSKCKLRLLKLERIKDYLLMEQEFIRNQEVFKPHEEKDKEERDKMEDIRGSPLAVGSLEEMIDDTRVVGVLDIHILDTYIHTYIHPCVRVAPRVDGVATRRIDATPSPRHRPSYIHTQARHRLVERRPRVLRLGHVLREPRLVGTGLLRTVTQQGHGRSRHLK
jgi:hypothetical protein